MLALPNPYYELWNSVAHRREYCQQPLRQWLSTRLRYLVSFSKWNLQGRFGPRMRVCSGERLTVILLSWKRVRNMEPMVRSLLKCDFVERVVVSNNNPEVRIRDWVWPRRARLELIDQPEAAKCGLRFRIAHDLDAKYFLCIDDDVFLYPRQVGALFDALVARPETPHGVHGEVQTDSGTGWSSGLMRFEGQVDMLNGVYAFTKAHVEEMFRLARLVGLDVARSVNDDVLLSFAGDARPRCHDVGPFPTCLSWARKGVAVWVTEDEFHDRRHRLFRALKERKPHDRVDERTAS